MAFPRISLKVLAQKQSLREIQNWVLNDRRCEKAIPVGDAAIYYGMLPSPYAIAPTQIEEFDYPSDINVMTHYQGSGGVPIGSWLQRFATAVYLRDPRLLITTTINADSKLLIRVMCAVGLRPSLPSLIFVVSPT